MPSRPDPEAPEGRGDGAAAGAVYGERPAPAALDGRVACLWWVAPAAGPVGRARAAPCAPRRPEARSPRPGPPAGGSIDRPAVPATLAGDAVGAILPDGCVDLVWHGGALTVAGPDTRARTGGAGAGTALGVRLRPGAATTFGASASDLRDRHPTAEQLWGAEGRRLTERVAEAASDCERLALLARAVARRAAQAPPTDPAVDTAVALLARGGTTVAGAAAAAGVGERQLRRRFLEHVGYGPKTLHRVLRLQRFLALAIATDEDLAGLAALAGFADQAHLNRDARSLAASTPARLVAARRPGVSETSKTRATASSRMRA